MKQEKKKMTKNICEECGIEFESKMKKKFCSEKCKGRAFRKNNPNYYKKKPTIKICEVCGREYNGTLTSKRCSKLCIKLAPYINKISESQVHKNDPDYVKCEVCGLYSTDLSNHVPRMHCPKKDYLSIFPKAKMMGEGLLKYKSEKVKGNKNPAYQHGGRLSPFSDKFIGKTTKEEVIAKANKTRKANPHKQTTNREFYLHNQTNANYDLSDYLLHERQAVGRKENFIKRYGEEEGVKRWKERQEKWLKSMPKTLFSMASQKLFWALVDEIGTEGVYFAQLANGVADFSGKNHELTVRHDKGWCKPDFIVGKKIIEFDGDYWHSGHAAKQRDYDKETELLNSGYKVLRIKEKDYYKNNQTTITKCLNYLTK
jgi:hypothetical protein